MQNRTHRLAIAASLSLAMTASAVAQDAANGAAKWGPHIDLEGRLGSKRHVGEASVFVPVLQDPNTLYFVNARARLDDDRDREGSLGIGARRMLDGGWNIGAYGFVDHRRTPSKNSFDQVTLGIEALGRDVDWRANLYTPIGKRDRTLSTTDAASFSGGSLWVTTTAREESALPGFDLEAGWRLPVFAAEDRRQVRAYVAGYRFADDGLKVQGARLRAEYLMAEFEGAWAGTQLALGAEVQHDRVRGSQSFVGVRLRIPLGSSQSGATSRRLNAQEHRMVAPVVRDVDVVTQVRSRTLAAEKASFTASGQRLIALTSAETTGAALPGEITAAGANSTVVLAGTFDTSAETYLQPGQTVMGAGSLAVRTDSGRATSVALPGAEIRMYMPGFFGVMATVNMADNSTLTGLTIRHLDPGGFAGANTIGVRADAVGNARILNNTVSSATSGAAGAFGIRVQGGSTGVIVANNVVSAQNVTSNAIALQVVEAQAQAVGNTLSAYGAAPANSYAVSLVGTSADVYLLPGSTGNRIQAGRCGLNIFPGFSVVGTMSFVDGTTCP
ncbi:inverse autotransporter beta domain-containing protein [Hydrogenophaga sp.]|uniref:inverse autotransporter beta domain-containing protein n=1 Tax=Hydrogenophaga sp. TaxID=1904254 RepID=UPI002718DC2D|nr:inverse autotransporter beta domain-containing protein [Hydrogenophaga sp.]MDO9437304.1 inverse autotransporter beta domain-containing protein [Hydrogenophaga sp.]